MKRRGGFTLIELLVVIGITACLATLTFSSFQRFRQAILLKATAQEFASELRKSQSLALSLGSEQYFDRFAFARSGAVLPGKSGTKVFSDRLTGRTKKVILSSLGRVRLE